MTDSTKRPPVGLQVDAVSIRFGDNVVVADVSLEVEPGEVFVIMGPSGAGKSVLLRSMIGLLPPTSGKVSIGGLPANDPATHRKIATSMVFQSGALFNSLTVFDNLAFYPREHRLRSEKDIARQVGEVLEMLSLGGAAGKFPSELSGGMKKRVAIARAIVTEPQVMLYDEPTSELDPIMAATISEVIGTLRRELGITSVVVSHDRELAAAIGDRMILLKNGQVRAHGTPAEVAAQTEPDIVEFFNPGINVARPRFRDNKS